MPETVASPAGARGSLLLIGGGARSGKSAFALRRARELGERRVFLATAQALDGEMEARIGRHREERGAAFRTVEEPAELARALLGVEADVVVVDCLTFWLSNRLLADVAEAKLREEIEEVAAALARRRFHALVVTNEVGLGLVPDNALGRAFRDLTGWAHQRLARDADEIYLGALGVMLRVHPGPVQRC